MSFLDKLFKKRQQPKSSDDYKVSLVTEKELSEEQKDAILTIIKDAVKDEEDQHAMAILIFMNVDIPYPVRIYRNGNSVEVII